MVFYFGNFKPKSLTIKFEVVLESSLQLLVGSLIYIDHGLKGLYRSFQYCLKYRYISSMERFQLYITYLPIIIPLCKTLNISHLICIVRSVHIQHYLKLYNVQISVLYHLFGNDNMASTIMQCIEHIIFDRYNKDQKSLPQYSKYQ